MTDLQNLLKLMQGLSGEYNKILRAAKRENYGWDSWEEFEIDRRDSEEILLYVELDKILNKIEDLKARVEYLNLPIKNIGQLSKNESGRYAIDEEHYWTSGDTIEFLCHDDGFSEYDPNTDEKIIHPYWAISTVEHDEDYYIGRFRHIKLDGLTVRIRGNANV